MSDRLAQAVDGLDKAGPVQHSFLAAVSGLERAEAARMPLLLAAFSTERQREVLAALVSAAERDFELEYGLIYRAFLTHDDAVMRRLSVEGLFEDTRLDLIKPLLRLLAEDPDQQVRAAVASALGRFVYAAEVEELPASHGSAIRKALERCFLEREASVEVARRALESLAFINDQSVTRYIDRAYSADEPEMRASAVFAMSRNADPRWADTVLAELYSDDPAMRYEAARACGELQLREAVETLARMIGEQDVEIRYMAVQALGQIGGKEARQVLERHAEGDDPELREAAEEALAEASLAEMAFDLMIVDQPDTVLLERSDDEEEGLSEEEQAFRDDFYAYTDEDEDQDWPDEYLSLN